MCSQIERDNISYTINGDVGQERVKVLGARLDRNNSPRTRSHRQCKVADVSTHIDNHREKRSSIEYPLNVLEITEMGLECTIGHGLHMFSVSDHHSPKRAV